MTDLYVVIQEGVYRHRIAGSFSTQEAAERVAERECNAEDGYHSFVVGKQILDNDVPFHGDVVELCTFSRARIPSGRYPVKYGPAIRT